MRPQEIEGGATETIKYLEAENALWRMKALYFAHVGSLPLCYS